MDDGEERERVDLGGREGGELAQVLCQHVPLLSFS